MPVKVGHFGLSKMIFLLTILRFAEEETILCLEFKLMEDLLRIRILGNVERVISSMWHTPEN